MPRPSRTDVPEGKLVDDLLADPDPLLLNIIGFPKTPLVCKCVQLASAPNNPRGDIDILLLPHDQPDHATAIQVKKIKIKPAAFMNNRPNRLKELEGAVDQTNLLVKLRFFQTYLYVLTVIDSREYYTREPYGGQVPEVKRTIEDNILNEIHKKYLSRQAGLILFHFEQIINKVLPAEEFNVYSARPDRIAIPGIQPPELTEWVRAVVKARRTP